MSAAGQVPPLDWIGFLLCGLTLATLLLGIEQVGGGRPAGWWSTALLVVAVGAGALTVLRMRRARHPLLDLDGAEGADVPGGQRQRHGLPDGDQRRAVPAAADVPAGVRLDRGAGRV